MRKLRLLRGGRWGMPRRPQRNVWDEYRVNDAIQSPRVKVVDENGTYLGEMSTVEALRLARGREKDLVELAADALSPLCKFLDCGDKSLSK